MGSSSHKHASQTVSVGLDNLKEKLNVLYKMRRTQPEAGPEAFDHLWDLKELAIVEGRSSVEVPKSWIDELNAALDNTGSGTRAH